MNNYGLVLAELGMGAWVDGLVAEVLQPLAAAALPEWGPGAIGGLDSSHAFTIR
jgi:hypothetical protein